MAFIIIDLEFNNLSGITKYYPNIFNEYSNLKELEIENEIIEIGAIKLDNYMTPLKEFKTFIKPKVFPILNPKISEITKIKEKDLISGVSFIDGINMLRQLIDEGDIICSWAKDDIAGIISNSIYHEYEDLSWIKNYLDIQEYSMIVLGQRKSLSLKKALDNLKIKIDRNKLHDALHDAIYTSFVFKRVYNSRVIKKYIVKDIYDMPALAIKDLKEYKINDDLVKQKCPRCNIGIEIEFQLKLLNWRFIALGECPRCNNKILDEVVVKRTLSGQDVYKEVSTVISELEYINYTYKLKNVE